MTIRPPNYRAALDAGWTVLLHVGCPRPGASEHGRSAAAIQRVKRQFLAARHGLIPLAAQSGILCPLPSAQKAASKGPRRILRARICGLTTAEAPSSRCSPAHTRWSNRISGHKRYVQRNGVVAASCFLRFTLSAAMPTLIRISERFSTWSRRHRPRAATTYSHPPVPESKSVGTAEPSAARNECRGALVGDSRVWEAALMRELVCSATQ